MLVTKYCVSAGGSSSATFTSYENPHATLGHPTMVCCIEDISANIADSWGVLGRNFFVVWAPSLASLTFSSCQISAASWQKQQNDCAPSESESLLCAQWVAKGPRFLHADSEDSDQTMLIWVFAGRTCHFVAFVMSRLISIPQKSLFLHVYANLKLQKAFKHEKVQLFVNICNIVKSLRRRCQSNDRL